MIYNRLLKCLVSPIPERGQLILQANVEIIKNPLGLFQIFLCLHVHRYDIYVKVIAQITVYHIYHFFSNYKLYLEQCKD